MPGTVPADSADPNGSVDEGPRVGADSHLTLHYRLTLAERGADIISTFGGKPATLQIGIGQLAEPLERCLMDLREGEHRRFALAPGEAFGPRNPELLQRLSRSVFDAHTTAGTTYEPGDLVELPAPGGGTVCRRSEGNQRSVGVVRFQSSACRPGHRLRGRDPGRVVRSL